MARKRRQKVQESDVTGTKYLRKLLPLLERLHDDGCARDKAGNRRLHFDQYCTLILLYLFNPVVVSLRSLQQASELQKVQKLLGCKRASLGSLSEAVTVFDPERLKEIIAELGTELVPLGRDPRLQDVPGLLTVVDGTLRIAQAIRFAWWKCRRRPMSNGESTGVVLPGLVPTASCGSPPTFSTCRRRRLRCCMSIAGQSRSSSGSSSMCWAAAIY
jgi:hypothetical protein